VYLAFLFSSFLFYNHQPEPLEDTEPPIVTLIDGDKNRIAVGSNWGDPGVDAYDIFGDINIQTEGEVDVNTVGEYTIKYIISDEAGNTTEAIRTVSIIKPTGTIYLTFDDGPSEHTGRLLDVLKKYNVKATFFVTGRGDDSYFKREYDEGHTVALHTNTHSYSYVYSSVDNYFEDLNTISDRVKAQTGEESKLLRFPGGSSNLVSTRYDHRSHIMSTLVNEVTARGYTYFDWNVDSNDAGGASSADEVYDNVTSRLVIGGDSVVLQHDVKGFSVDAVERIIQYGIEHDFIFKKLDKDSFNAHHSVNN
jgi:peptidoglycan/xylan/chitin deacetylase (PgdA/CDA1 family)